MWGVPSGREPYTTVVVKNLISDDYFQHMKGLLTKQM